MMDSGSPFSVSAKTTPAQPPRGSPILCGWWHECWVYPKLLETPRSQPQEESVRNRLYKQRDHLFTFLDHEGVDATNNLAERQLRPAVISRKISCGNKTAKGARTWQILASIAATCAQQAQSFIATLARAAPLQGR
jgi:transposase